MNKRDRAILEAANKVMERHVRYGECINRPIKIKELLRYRIGALDHEVFVVVILDNRHKVLDIVDLFRGTIDGSAVYPRDVLKMVLDIGGAAMIFAHNHPSGDPSPSQADIRITEKLVKALNLIDVRVLDHIVVGNPEIISFAELGHI